MSIIELHISFSSINSFYFLENTRINIFLSMHVYPDMLFCIVYVVI